jgi:hypothetical protein
MINESLVYKFSIFDLIPSLNQHQQYVNLLTHYFPLAPEALERSVPEALKRSVPEALEGPTFNQQAQFCQPNGVSVPVLLQVPIGFTDVRNSSALALKKFSLVASRASATIRESLSH